MNCGCERRAKGFDYQLESEAQESWTGTTTMFWTEKDKVQVQSTVLLALQCSKEGQMIGGRHRNIRTIEVAVRRLPSADSKGL